jgi:hypothetical protein
MSQTWYRLFLPTADAGPVAAALASTLGAQGYAPYDPFPGGTGTPPGLTALTRMFVAPPQEGWVVVLGEFPDSLLPDFSRAIHPPVIYGWLTDQSGGFALYQDGTRHDDPGVFAPCLRPGQTLDTLRRAFAGEIKVEVLESGQPPVVALGADALPPELRQMAEDQGADPDKAGKMFGKVSGKLFDRLSRQSGASAEEQEQARAMFMGGGHDNWNSLNGQRARAIARVLNLPANWRLPTWTQVREAYQAYRLRQRAPRMALLPGDKEAMAAVPNALDYIPVYMGKK